MSADYSDAGGRAKELISRAYYLPEGDERIMMLEEAVRQADTANDVKLQYDAREAFIEAAYFGGIPEKAMVAYAWCLAQYDRDPVRFREWNILWRYKWMVNVVCDFPQISKEQIYEMLDDMGTALSLRGGAFAPSTNTATARRGSSGIGRRP
jgi:hypothetical protein